MNRRTVDSRRPTAPLIISAAAAGLLLASLTPVAGAGMQPNSAPAASAAPAKKVSGDATVKVTKVKSKKGGLRIFGKVVGVSEKQASVYLEHKKPKKKSKNKKKWRVVVRSSTNNKGKFKLRYDHRKGKYRVKAVFPSPAPTPEPPKPTPATPVVPPKPAPAPAPEQGLNWVVAMGDSYMSGEGAPYAGYGPQTNSSGAYVDKWWTQIFGSSLKEVFPGDYSQPIQQPGLTDQQRREYDSPLYGWLCHRSGTASMYWGDHTIAALNLACSGATSNTQVDTGKPGVDFESGTYDSPTGPVDVLGQAAQLQKFATKAKKNGDNIEYVLLSIGGNDIGFDPIVTQCVTWYIELDLRSCGSDSSSLLNKQYDNGGGLVGVKNAVVNSGKNIVKAMRAAGYKDGSYTIQVAAYPIGVTDNAGFASQFSSYPKRQEYCGIGLDAADLDLVSGGFKQLLRQRSIEGAAALATSYPKLGIRVVDASDAMTGHELCSAKLSYPQISSSGTNTMHPDWYGPMGGSTAAWLSPVWACAEVGLLCGFSTLYNELPNLMTAMDCNADSSGKCTNSLAKSNVQDLALHPSYFGQRALSTCQQAATDQANRRVIRCTPPSNPGSLDPVGRPKMNVQDTGPLQ
jgi:lysophospholipase L1-like esterase